MRPKATEFGEITQTWEHITQLRRLRSFKVTEFGTKRKLMCDVLLVND